jgi:AcrR family transcriptional regulator
MRPQKINDTELLQGLMMVLRTKGYDGASLNDLADSSGLQKASLYHRFPGGKKDIGLAVLNFVEEWKEKNIISVINNTTLEPTVRLETVIEKITYIYDNGQCSCVMKALSIGNGLELFNDELKEGAKRWLKALTKLGVDFGLNQSASETLAMQVLVKIQGSLIVSINLNDTNPFESALNEIRTLYIKN